MVIFQCLLEHGHIQKAEGVGLAHQNTSCVGQRHRNVVVLVREGGTKNKTKVQKTILQLLQNVIRISAEYIKLDFWTPVGFPLE